LPVMRHKSELGVTLNNVVSCYPGVAPMEHVTLPTMKLTQLAVDRIGKPAVGRLEYFDSQLPGFGLRVADTGHKSWVVMYRVAGKLQRYTIDTLARLPKVEDARDKARAIMQEAARGGDPAAAKKASKIEGRVAIPQDPDTVRAVAARFVEGYCRPKNRSWAETERTHATMLWRGGETVNSLASRAGTSSTFWTTSSTEATRSRPTGCLLQRGRQRARIIGLSQSERR
jgi:hypothetical protein